jgi:hypothetical protein
MYCVARRRPAELATIASATAATPFDVSWILFWRARISSSESSPSAQPPAGASANHGVGAAACGELKREIAAQRIADDVCGPKSGFVHRTLDCIGSKHRTGGARDRRPSCVTRQRRREHVMAALEHRQHELPRPPRVHEAVQADEWRAGAASMRRREAREHFRQR